MLAGKVIEESKIGDYSVKIRYPKFEDLEDILKYINSPIEDYRYSSRQKRINKKEGLELLSDLLRSVENKEAVVLVAEINGKVQGMANIDRKKYAQSHVCDLGIVLRKNLRGRGIGKRLTELVIKEAVKNLKIEIVELEVFAENKVALNLYKKLGFKKVGVIKKRIKKDGKYSDQILMVKYL